MDFTEEIIRNFYGQAIAIKRIDENGDITIKDYPSRMPLAKYIKANDHTIIYPSRQIVARGDVTNQYIKNK